VTRVWRWLRIAAVLLTVSTLCAFFGVHLARARTAGWLDQMGDVLRDYARAPEGNARTTLVRMNGLSFQLSTLTRSAALGEVLDEAEATCTSGGAGFEDVVHAPTAARKRLARIAGIDGILRAQGATSGVVACFVPNTSTRTLAGFAEAAMAFSRDFDPSVFGSLRYVHASLTSNDTFVLHVTHHGVLPLRLAFPASGDAPGQDLTDFPRPRDSTRILSTTFGDHASSFHAYRMNHRSLHAAAREYEQALREHGHVAHRHGDSNHESRVLVLGVVNPHHLTQFTFEQAGDDVTVAIARMF
jgi:hypothetical protein